MNLCLSDQALLGAITGAVTVALAWIAARRALARLTTGKHGGTRVTDHHHADDG